MKYPISSREIYNLLFLSVFAILPLMLTAQCNTAVNIVNPSQVFCNAPGSHVTLTAQPLGGVFSGQAVRGDGFIALDNLAAGSYWMYYTAPDSCLTRDSVEIHIQEVTSQISQLNPYNCADNRSSLLQVVASNEETLFFEGLDWNLNVQPQEFETRALPNVHTYRLDVVSSTTGQSCISQVQPAFVNPTQVQTRANLDCEADSIGIEIQGIQLPETATWKHYSDFAYAKTGPVTTGMNLSPDRVGHYQLNATYSNGCKSEKNIWVPAIDSFLPHASLPSRLLLPCTNEEVSLPLEVTTSQTSGEPYFNWISDGNQRVSDSTIMNPMVDEIGTYTVFVTDRISGCSTAPLSVRVSQAGPQQDTFYQAICHDSFYDWEGRRYRASGVYGRSFLNSFGCDSNRVLILDVLAKAEDTLNVFSCSGSIIEFGGDSLRTSGVYTKAFNSSRGCDSTVTLNLEIEPLQSHIIHQTICAGDSYQLGAEMLTEGGQYDYLFQTQAGCDSLVELTLEVVPQFSQTSEAEICQGDTYLFQNRAVYVAGQYADTLTSSLGCDSIHILNLEVIPTSITEIVEFICEGEAFQISGQSFTETGLYTLAFGASNGCDSLINIDLTVFDAMILTLDTINQSGNRIGDVVVRVEGGIAPYQFSWSNGVSGDNVPVGTEVSSVQVIDASGCEQVLILNGATSTNSAWVNKFELGPNPTQGPVQWRLKNGNYFDQLELLNAQGQRISKITLAGQKQGQLDLTNFPAGLYFLEFSATSGQKSTAKLMRF